MTTTDLLAEERAREFYAKFGFAFSEAQILERAVMAVLSAHAAYKFKGRISKDEMLGLRSKIEKRTLGPLILEMKKSFEFRESDLKKLECALIHRNDLAHGFLWRNCRTMIAPGGLEKLTFQLVDMTDKIMEATRVANAAYDAILKRMGLGGIEHEKAFERHLREEYKRIQRGE